MGWRNETKIVFVTDELRDLRERGGEIFGGCWEIGAAAIGFCNGFQLFVGLSKAFGGGLCFFDRGLAALGMLFFGGLGTAEFAAERDGQDADFGGFQAGQQILRRSGGRRINTSRKKDEGFLAGNVGEPIESRAKAGGQI